MSNSAGPHGLWPSRLLCPWGFFRQEHWSGLPYPPPGDLPDPGIEPTSPMTPAWAGGFLTTSATWELGIVMQGLHYLGDKLVLRLLRG